MKKDLNFYELFLSSIHEKGLSILDLERANVLHKNVFYRFKYDCPSLKNAIQIANFLQFSIDYILENSDENHFYRYKYPLKDFYKTLMNVLKESNVKKSTLANGANFRDSNYTRWKRGSQPKLSTLIEIARFLNCKIDDLLEKEK